MTRLPAMRLTGALCFVAAVAAAPLAFAQTATAPAPAPAPAPADAAAPMPMAAAATAKADVLDAEGKSLGTVTIADTASKQLHVTVALTGLPPGPRGIHIHEVGKCDAPDFKSAGGHLSGGHDHGILSPTGTHQGDLPNLTVDAEGKGVVEYFTPGVTVADVLDADGGAVVVHAKPDDYSSQPAGDSGDQVACGVFAPAS